MVLGHDLSSGQRTHDVRISKDYSFDSMLLSKSTLGGLRYAGFLKPSPIQLQGIPLGKCGFDLLLEAKSGTGKTAVFTVISLEKLYLNLGIQTIIIAPTREIASQITDVIAEIGSQYEGLNVVVVMGGLPVIDDIKKLKEKVHIVVGSPGRLRHLIHSKHIDLSAVRLVVLDEADKLMEKSFLPDINYIFSLLPRQKQVIMSSATYTAAAKTFISKYVQNAQHICPDNNSVLLGITQKVAIVPHNVNIVKQTKHRYEELKKILNSKQFKQCLIFCNYQVRVSELHRMLTRDKWPAEKLYGQQEQIQRLDALKTLQEYKCRILVSTDLAARGIDASNVDIVINFEPPLEWQTYLHRIGRAGRYGSYGTAISILSDGKEKTKFKDTLSRTNLQFNLSNLWDDMPFNVNLKEDVTAVTTLPDNNTISQNENKTENILWTALTTESLREHDIEPEIYSFEDFCDSFATSTKPIIETVSDTLHSLTTNQNEISNRVDVTEFKYVKVAKIPIDIVKYWDNLDTSYAYQINGHSNVTDLNIEPNGDSVNEKESNGNERHLTEEMEKDHSENNVSKCVEITSPKILNSKYTESDNSTSDAQVNLRKHNHRRSGQIEKNPTSNQALINMGLPTAFGKKKLSKKYKGIKKFHDFNTYNESNSSKTEMYPIKQAVEVKYLPNTFGRNKQGEYHNKNNELKTGGTEIKPNKQSLVDADATLFNKIKQDSHSRIRRHHDSDYHFESTAEKTSIDPMNQHFINAGLPSAFGTVGQNKSHSYHRSNDDNDRKNLQKPKIKQTQQKPMKMHEVVKKAVPKKISSSKTFTRDNFKHEYLSTTVVDPSDSSCESSCDEKNASKLRNNYATHASTYQHKKQNSIEEREQENRGKQFDAWYNQLQHQVKYIRYALYIEELKQL